MRPRDLSHVDLELTLVPCSRPSRRRSAYHPYLLVRTARQFTPPVFAQATAAGAEDASTFNVGSWIMLGGIVAQLVVTLIFLAVFGVYFSRLRSRHNVDIRYADSHLKVVFWGIIAISSLIVIRCILAVSRSWATR